MTYKQDISIVISSDEDENVKSLVEKMYGWRGYTISVKSDIYRARTITIGAAQRGEIQATLTIAFDGEGGLSVDHHFPHEVEILRLRPHFLCEFTRLANKSNDLHVVGALFHAAVILAHNIKHASYVVIEVNPRHAGYYKKMLGFHVLSDATNNQTVGAPAVLLGKAFRGIMRCIRQHQSGKPFGHRTMYTYFFDRDREREITLLLKKH